MSQAGKTTSCFGGIQRIRMSCVHIIHAPSRYLCHASVCDAILWRLRRPPRDRPFNDILMLPLS